MPKTYRNHRGVRIFRTREIITGSDFDFTSDGRIKSTRAKYEKWFHFTDGAKCETLNECKQMVDDLLQQAADRNIPEQMMVDTLNSSETNG